MLKLKIANGINKKHQGFILSVDYNINNLVVGVLAGIYKKPYFKIVRGNFSLGYLYIKPLQIISLYKTNKKLEV